MYRSAPPGAQEARASATLERHAGADPRVPATDDIGWWTAPVAGNQIEERGYRRGEATNGEMPVEKNRSNLRTVKNSLKDCCSFEVLSSTSLDCTSFTECSASLELRSSVGAVELRVSGRLLRSGGRCSVSTNAMPGRCSKKVQNASRLPASYRRHQESPTSRTMRELRIAGIRAGLGRALMPTRIDV